MNWSDRPAASPVRLERSDDASAWPDRFSSAALRSLAWKPPDAPERVTTEPKTGAL
jgi:hypothetical protein